MILGEGVIETEELNLVVVEVLKVVEIEVLDGDIDIVEDVFTVLMVVVVDIEIFEDVVVLPMLAVVDPLAVPGEEHAPSVPRFCWAGHEAATPHLSCMATSASAQVWKPIGPSVVSG